MGFEVTKGAKGLQAENVQVGLYQTEAIPHWFSLNAAARQRSQLVQSDAGLQAAELGFIDSLRAT